MTKFGPVTRIIKVICKVSVFLMIIPFGLDAAKSNIDAARMKMMERIVFFIVYNMC